jgi:uncharacterized protein YlaI
MTHKCVLCDEKIEEEFGKLKGTIIKIKNENNKRELAYVCSECQKRKDWMNDAKIKAA